MIPLFGSQLTPPLLHQTPETDRAERASFYNPEDNYCHLPAGGQFPDKGTVQLDELHGKFPQVIEASIPDAKIVNDQPYAHLAKGSY